MKLKDLQQTLDQVQENFSRQFPGGRQTVQILIWDDGDYLIQIRHGDDYFIHKVELQKSVGKIEYKKEEVGDFDYDTVLANGKTIHHKVDVICEECHQKLM